MKKWIFAALEFIFLCLGFAVYHEYGQNRLTNYDEIVYQKNTYVDRVEITSEELPTPKEVANIEPEEESEVSIEVTGNTEYYAVLNNNVPLFIDNDLTTDCFESYSELDEYGRCAVVYACFGKETMPTEERGTIGNIKPSGWIQTFRRKR